MNTCCLLKGRRGLRPGWLLFLLLMVCAVPSHATVTFQPFVNYSTGLSPLRLVAADFNGNREDLAVIRENSNTVSVFLNNNDGTFQPAVAYTAGTTPLDLVMADFNNDGNRDLATANYGSDSVSVFPGNGSGGFGSRIDFTHAPAIYHPVLLLTADFTGDGKADLAVVNERFGLYDETLSLATGNGDGTFTYTHGYALGYVPSAAIVADFNNDGKKDLAFLDGVGNKVGIWLGDGSGDFVFKGLFTTGSQPVALLSVDLNGDGKADLAVVNQGGNSVSILLGNGDGTFQAKTDYSIGVGPRAITAGDFTADNKTDLVTANFGDNTFSLLRGNGNGTLQAKSDFAAGTNPRAIVAGDFNGDGKPDVAVANNGTTNISVFINATQSSVTFDPTTWDFGSVPYNSQQRYQYFTISNGGEAAMTISAIDTSGTDAGMFIASSGGANPCPSLPTTLFNGGSCTVEVTFTPSSAGGKSAFLRVTHNGTASPQTATLSGTGIAPTTYSLTLTITNTGGGAGTVTIQPPSGSSLVCSGSCSKTVNADTVVQLFVNPDANTIITWTGCTMLNSCFQHTSTASIFMNSAKSLTATFTHVEPAQVNGGQPGYAVLQNAYDAAGDGSIIKSRSVTFNENLLLNRNVGISLLGGYGDNTSAYDYVAGVTTLSGSLTVTDGTATVAGVEIVP